jgi:hypothetical protein
VIALLDPRTWYVLAVIAIGAVALAVAVMLDEIDTR